MKYKWLVIVLIAVMSACQKIEELQPVSTVTPSTRTVIVNKPIDQYLMLSGKNWSHREILCPMCIRLREV